MISKTRARAPGKVVLSGAYSVLEGAPAIVAAVDRYVEADATLPPGFVTPEVRAAVGSDRVPWFDAAALREDGRKLGLGSSAAILVASLGAIHLAENREITESVREDIFRRSLVAHRTAQGGGSGVDVASAAYGGILVARLQAEGLSVRRCALPSVHVEVWATQTPASTAELVSRVRALKASAPERYAGLLSGLSAAAERTVLATDRDDAATFVDGLATQATLFRELGRASGAAIVTPDVAALFELARRSGSVVLPAGAGGGDVNLYVGLGPPPASLSEEARKRGQSKLSLELGAEGVHARRSVDM